VTPLRIVQYYQSFESQLVALRAQANSCALSFQHVYSSHAALKASGLVELGVREILGEYARRNSNRAVKNFVENVVEWENSLNCEKIEKLLNRFDSTWWPSVRGRTTLSQQSAINSLKTLRDQYAHGKYNGTGYLIVEGYYFDAKQFVLEMADQIVP
jgi:hypothetical protein